MKNARFKIAALVGGSVLLTLLIILVLFQVISSKRTEELAKEAIQAYSEVTLGETSAMQYTPTTPPRIRWSSNGAEKMTRRISRS